MSQYRVTVQGTRRDIPFCAYNGQSVNLALEIASQYELSEIVTVEFKHADGSWRVVTSREGLNNGIPGETGGIPDDLVRAGHDSRLGY